MKLFYVISNAVFVADLQTRLCNQVCTTALLQATGCKTRQVFKNNVIYIYTSLLGTEQKTEV